MKQILLFLAMSFWAMGACSTPLSVSVTTASNETWEISVLSGSFAANENLLKLQPWWGDETLAQELADLVKDDLGLPNSNSLVGPAFAYLVQDASVTGPGLDAYSATWVSQPWIATGLILSPDSDAGYAIATQAAPVPEDSVLVLLALSLAGLSLVRGRSRQR